MRQFAPVLRRHRTPDHTTTRTGCARKSLLTWGLASKKKVRVQLVSYQGKKPNRNSDKQERSPVRKGTARFWSGKGQVEKGGQPLRGGILIWERIIGKERKLSAGSRKCTLLSRNGEQGPRSPKKTCHAFKDCEIRTSLNVKGKDDKGVTAKG